MTIQAPQVYRVNLLEITHTKTDGLENGRQAFVIADQLPQAKEILEIIIANQLFYWDGQLVEEDDDSEIEYIVGENSVVLSVFEIQQLPVDVAQFTDTMKIYGLDNLVLNLSSNA